MYNSIQLNFNILACYFGDNNKNNLFDIALRVNATPPDLFEKP